MTAKKNRPNIDPRLQVPCCICGALTDLPAVWSCVCGAYVVCYRSACHLKIPVLHLRGDCGPHAGNVE